ncbi:Secretory lipase OS=Tsukamurella paurometabola (strain ATCC 8368 / DSM / CCUG 35730 / CIP 100753/ JCM 10117 / KCTC 9821 / NBRC 16120 / NCIMB 702349 / NCTC 13040) OX=521096 GN=Tpau_3563 PE=3 SV=1 [Tsukamurella paurometabola]|uniref:Secretory lipase n=1 Tax=Tsukamurella paurometabola (strain ATCC 8368 / DSM 20162 / CCUG 35730 / CIP 100753 / JCM 10117 / KCTC 9821 / NBRC 16120 / NCIMB 702349 / NCTC 13040) TaxID=521096 RepID=D5UXC3_TSUPD|nr:secretory lipase [Tsukamurella paurometabola DSM 20162]SUP38572.1 Secretory lipase [Tsukamurella paurometabola]
MAATALVMGLSISACTTPGGPPSPSASSAAPAPGALLTQRPLTGVDPATVSAGSMTYLRYRSTAPSGGPVEVSGALFLPAGAAPAGGWPVVAFGHGTSGVANSCAPTSSPTLFGSAPVVAQLVRQGAAVVMTNYQGLDGPGAAPYGDAVSSGYDVLDSVRAARATGLPLADRTILVGVSQGGRAAESAAESAAQYAPELDLRGSVLLSPGLITRFADAVSAGTLNAPEQYLVLPYLVSAARYGDPGFGFDQLLGGDLLAAAPRLAAQCTGQADPADAATARAGDARFASAQAERTFRNMEERTDVPRRGHRVPTYVVRGDADRLVSTPWTAEGVARMCALGTPVRDVVVPGGHEAPAAVTDLWLGWIAGLLRGSTDFTPSCPG